MKEPNENKLDFPIKVKLYPEKTKEHAHSAAHQRYTFLVFCDVQKMLPIQHSVTGEKVLKKVQIKNFRSTCQVKSRDTVKQWAPVIQKFRKKKQK